MAKKMICWTDDEGDLIEYRTGNLLRRATVEEIAASDAAGGQGLIEVDVTSIEEESTR